VPTKEKESSVESQAAKFKQIIMLLLTGARARIEIRSGIVFMQFEDGSVLDFTEPQVAVDKKENSDVRGS
jgi:hypothetical protein